MKVLFENEQEKEWNKLNKNSVKFRLSDLEQIEKMENVTFLDENDKKISDAEIYLPPSKAYIIINRVHFGEAGRVFDGDKEAILKRMISYFLYPKNLKYLASALYLELEGSNIPEEILERIGFYPIRGNNSIFRMLNREFDCFLEYSPTDKEIKSMILQMYKELVAEDRKYLDDIRNQLEVARKHLQAFISQGSVVMIEAKREEIAHYEAILGIEQTLENK